MKHSPLLSFATATLITLTAGCALYLEDPPEETIAEPAPEQAPESAPGLETEPDNVVVVGESSPPSPSCESILNEGLWCASLDYNDGLVAIGMESGNSCNLISSSGGDTSSIAALGASVYACRSSSAIGLSLVNGTPQTAFGVSCDAMTDWNDGLLVYSLRDFNIMHWYPSFAALVADQPGQSLTIAGVHASRLAADGDQLYAAWHATDTVQMFSLPDGDLLGEITLEGHDDWINGMDVIDGQLFVLDRENNILIFDATTGAAQGAIPYTGSAASNLGGLKCFSAATSE